MPIPTEPIVYKKGKLARAVQTAVDNKFDSFTVQDILNDVYKELPHVRASSVYNRVTNVLCKIRGQLTEIGTSTSYDRRFAHTKPAKTEIPHQPKDESVFFSSADIGKHILTYVNSLKMEVLNLNDTLAQRDKQILDLQKCINDTRMEGGLTGKEIMEGANS